MSEQILNSMSSQSGYTVPFTFMLVHARKYRTEDKLKIQTIHRLNTKPRKANNAKHNITKLLWFSAFYDTRPGNNAPKPARD